MKLICVIQRYGDEIVGGAELHCRLIAAHLAKDHSVEIVTTCALNYLTWENVYPSGTSMSGGLPVHRFPAVRHRPDDFDSLAYHTLYGHPTPAEQRTYLEALGPVCPELIQYLKSRTDVDRFIVFSYRYWTAVRAIEAIADRAVLVPTAEHDRTLYLGIYRDVFRQPGAIAYNSIEERRLINDVSGNHDVPGVTVGVGLPQTAPAPDSVLRELDVKPPYFLYIGRIEEAKGCPGMIRDYRSLCAMMDHPPRLFLIGKREMTLPSEPGLCHLGILPDDVKLTVLAGATALIMPSRYESLSMVVLEAWRMHRPVLCNARCEVLRGQCIRAGGGLYYRTSDEFLEAAMLLTENTQLADTLGMQGNQYYNSHYSWTTILGKYRRLLAFQGDVA
ncbi:MAG TPA: glycosyltransferase family 4 protein [bacterium]|nr:glycosyltransferase family 4 protein [bacterium]